MNCRIGCSRGRATCWSLAPARETTWRLHSGIYVRTTFVSWPCLDKIPASIDGVAEVTEQYRERAALTEVATDDWPFFYMLSRTYPITYAVMVVILLGLSSWLVRRQLGTP